MRANYNKRCDQLLVISLAQFISTVVLIPALEDDVKNISA